MQAGSPGIKAENPEMSRATECHILVVGNRREKREAEGEKLQMLEEKEERWRRG